MTLLLFAASMVLASGAGTAPPTRAPDAAPTTAPVATFVPWNLALLVHGSAGILGGLCLDGIAHVNGTASPVQLSPGCNQEISGGFEVEPPLIYTETDSFPGTTYYYARVEDIGGGVPGLRIYDRYFQPLAGQTNFLESFIGAPPNKYPPGFQINFNSAARVQEAFDEATGLFASIGGQPVVVNFGLPSPMMPGGLTYLEFDGSSSSVIRATIINTRFTGPSSPDTLRLNTDNWIGGWVFVKQVTFEPRLGVGLIAHNFQKSGGSYVGIGTTAWPCLTYLTGHAASYDLSAGVNSNFVLNGSMIVLGSWSSTGGPAIIFNPGFLEHLPPGLRAAAVLPAGSCCFPDGLCQEISRCSCLAAGSYYEGDGTNCAASPRCGPVGARSTSWGGLKGLHR